FVYEIIGTVEPLAFELCGQHSTATVCLQAYDLAVTVRAIDHEALGIKRYRVRAKERDHSMSVVQLHSRSRIIFSGKSAVREKHGNFSGVRTPLVNDVRGNIAEQKVASLANPDRPLEESEIVGHFLNLCVF